MSNRVCQSHKKAKNDVIYTPEPVAKLMISMCPLVEGQHVLDPCRGMNIVFFKNFPRSVRRHWDEIEEGKDFFKREEQVDWVIGNPPYSLWDRWIEKTLEITRVGFCYLFGFLNFNEKRLEKITRAGFGITKMHLLSIDWYFGRSMVVVFERNKENIITFSPKYFCCDVCGGRCRRGRGGRDANKCGKAIY